MPTDVENGEYFWVNSAGVKWPLKQRKDEPKKMKVGTACPYYEKGYTEALLKFNDDGKVIAIQGPNNEYYTKTSAKPIKEPAVVKCNDDGYKVCPANHKSCKSGYFYDTKSCECFTSAVAKCKQCPAGQTYDPRVLCKCIPIHEKEAMNRCGNWKAKDKAKELKKIALEFKCDNQGYKKCPIKHKSCPQGSVYDDEACACFTLAKCRKMCPPGQALDPREMCSCIPIAEKEALNRCGDWKEKDAAKKVELEFKCDDNGYKRCPVKHQNCPKGSFYNDKACTCFTHLKCRKMCPPGQALDPREVCSCIP